MEEYRKLLVLGLNAAISQGRLSLKAPTTNAPTDEDGYMMLELGGYPSVFLWNSISIGELRVSVWWNYEHSKHPQANAKGNAQEMFTLTKPLAKRLHYPKFVGATVSGWLERKTGKHLQGRGKQGLFDTYLRKDMKEKLRAMSVPVANGFEAEGKFFP